MSFIALFDLFQYFFGYVIFLFYFCKKDKKFYGLFCSQVAQPKKATE